MNIFRRGSSRNDYANAEIRRVMNGELRTVARGTEKNIIVLSPMKSLSIEGFTFPFHNQAKVREALRLRVMPFSAAGELEIFPVLLDKSGREGNGIVWYVSPKELEKRTRSFRIWPAPLPFVAGLKEFGGNGITVWADELNICSILWQSNRPVLYRWMSRSDDNSLEEHSSWYDIYCREAKLARGGTFTFYTERYNNDCRTVISESLQICPWIASLNFSGNFLEGAKTARRSFNALNKAAMWLITAGAVILGAEVLDYYDVTGSVRETRTRSENVYRETFDPQRTGRISNPVTLARDKIASLTNKANEGHQIDEVLADMGEIYEMNKDSKVTIDIIRYNTEGIDCTGTAPDMTTVLNFRRSWEQKANTVQVDNTQFVAGIGYRFDIRIRW